MNPELNIRVFKNIDDLGRDSIDSFVDDGFFTYGWFKTLEEFKSLNFDPFYVAAFYKDEVVAFLPCFLDVPDQYFSFGPPIPFMKRVLNFCNSLGIRKRHVLLSYSPFCYRTKCFTTGNLKKDVLTYGLINKIDEICKKEKILFSSFLFVSGFDNSLLTNLTKLGYHRFLRSSNYYLDVVWSSFDEYLASLEKKIRNRAKKEMKSCINNGVIIKEDVEDFKDLSTKLSDLSSNLFAKYNKAITRVFDSSFYESLNEHAGNNVKLFIAEKNDVVTGFALCLRQGKTLDLFSCGFDYETQDKSDFTYFNLCYYAPIKWAIQEGIKKIYYRQTADRVKLKRGCELEKIYSFVKCHNKPINMLLGNYARAKTKN